MSSIQDVIGREILDSRGNPTVEVEVTLSNGLMARAGVPSGASTGAHEAHELRDGDANRYKGKGVLEAVKNVNSKIKETLIGKTVDDQKSVDDLLLKLDGSENKSNLGANSILGASLAVAKLRALENNIPFFKSLEVKSNYKIPVPLMNVLNGGSHADNNLDVQEFMLVPFGFDTFKESLRAGAEVFHTLKKILSDDSLSTSVGDEGGFAPNLKSNKQALDLLLKAIEKAGYRPGEQIGLALDVAATEFFVDEKYIWEGQKIESSELMDHYSSWKKSYPLLSIEDGFSEDDWDSWITYNARENSQEKSIQLVGDDLFVTNVKRLSDGIEKKAANALLVKVNQIGTLSETIAAIKMANSADFKTVMSHRSGETEDVTIADLSVGLGSEQIKTGGLCRSERIAKYNQLLRIEEHLGSKGSYWGKGAFN